MTAYGEPPSPVSPPPGCRFNTRCPLTIDQCRTEAPQLTLVARVHEVRCHRWEEVGRLKPSPHDLVEHLDAGLARSAESLWVPPSGRFSKVVIRPYTDLDEAIDAVKASRRACSPPTSIN